MGSSSGQYRNLFEMIGRSREEVDARLEQIWNIFFYGKDDERIYFPVEPDMGYLTDTGNTDVRTEGMSYGMMLCVQTDHKEEFDRIWKWTYTYMWHTPGTDNPEEGYFAWSCALDGRHNAEGAAPDGEEYFAMALFFASHRWGDGEGIFEYSKHARTILRAMIFKGSSGRPGKPMWNHDNKQILFVAGSNFSDPSYHLPHYYTLFSQWADEDCRDFLRETVSASRKYIAESCNPRTGMCAEYAEFDGRPLNRRPGNIPDQRHNIFYSDAYRTCANIGLDYEWNGIDEGQRICAGRLIRFLMAGIDDGAFEKSYEIDGRVIGEAKHPVGLLATTAEGLLAFVDDAMSEEDRAIAVKLLGRLWDTPLREGKYRYYDNCLYYFAFLALGGRYRVW